MIVRPIIFSAPMVRANLEDRKTQTRRILALRGHRSISEFGRSDTPGYAWHFRDAGKRWHDLKDEELRARLHFAAGDLLWVREAWAKDPLITGGVRYYATDNVHELRKKHPSIHMPRWASRLTLRVTAVTVERLQEISEADAIAEGIRRSPHGNGDQWMDYPEGSSAAGWTDPRDSFRSLWNAINGPDAWDANPFVVAVTYEVIRENVDRVIEREAA